MIRAVLLLLALALPARAEEIVLGLGREEVAITATFDGSELLIFGAVRREAPIRLDPPLEVIVTVSGPLTPVVVRHAERVAGIWVNTAEATVDAAPSFYAVATSAPLREVVTWTEDMRHSISIPEAIRSVGNEVSNSSEFTQALIRIREAQGDYEVFEGAVDFEKATLFRTEITLPANLIEGAYTARIFLTRDRQVIDRYDTLIPVRKVGLERWLFNLSREAPLLYGLMSLALAAAAGWGASAGFQALRR